MKITTGIASTTSILSLLTVSHIHKSWILHLSHQTVGHKPSERTQIKDFWEKEQTHVCASPGREWSVLARNYHLWVQVLLLLVPGHRLHPACQSSASQWPSAPVDTTQAALRDTACIWKPSHSCWEQPNHLIPSAELQVLLSF